MYRTIMAVTALATLALAAPVDAQDRWGLEFRMSGAVATQDVDRATHQKGVGFEGTVRYRFLPHLSAYVGWDWTYFPAHESFAGPDADLEETGYAGGLRFEHPLRAGARTAYWVRIGATYNHLELEDADGELVANTAHGLGWEAGVGLALQVSERWSLTPGFRYRSLSRDLELATATMPVELQYVEFGLGMARTF
jgi:opacity protein-like surface antigen